LLNRKFAAVAIAAAVALGTTGCTFTSPVASRKIYDPSDGVNATVGKVMVRDFMYLTNAAGQGALFGSIVNQDVDAVATTVSIHAADSSSTAAIPVSVGAGEKLDLGYNGGQAIPLGINVKAGTIEVVHVTVGSDQVSLNVPVLDGTLSQYAPLVNGIATLSTPAPKTK
jgi:hypothetical protein